MNVIETICNRRSIRTFTEKPIASDTMKNLLTAAMYAPSAGNQRPWEFITITEYDTKRELKAALPNGGMLPQCDTAIAVCADLRKEVYPGFWVQDCSAAVQNILLSATSLGLGSVWLGVHPMEEWSAKVGDILNLPEKVKPFGIVALGYSSQEVTRPERFDDRLIHSEKWQK